MGIKSNMKELLNYLNYQRRDSIISTKYVKKQLKQEEDKHDFYKFKKAIFEQLDKLFYEPNYQKVFIRPKSEKAYLYSILAEDKDFNLYYNHRFTSGGEIEISLRGIDELLDSEYDSEMEEDLYETI